MNAPNADAEEFGLKLYLARFTQVRSSRAMKSPRGGSRVEKVVNLDENITLGLSDVRADSCPRPERNRCMGAQQDRASGLYARHY